MILSFVAIGLIGILGWVWLTRGFFSAFLHLLCTVAAGAMAFAVWEPVAYLLLDVSPERGFFGRAISSTAWGVGLVLPFAAFLALLRVAVDKAIPANATAGDLPNYIGGAICGALAGVITVGILVIGIGSLRLSTDWLGHQRITFNQTDGGLERTSRLLFPVDDIVGGVYSRLSLTTFRADGQNSLARLHPAVADVAATSRMSLGSGRGRNTYRPGDFEVIGHYAVGVDESRLLLDGLSLPDLLRDQHGETPQRVASLDGQPFPPNSHVEGFVVQYQATATEDGSSQIVSTPGQIRLVLESRRGGESKAVHPIAVISRADPQALPGEGRGSDRIRYIRYRADSRGFHLPSVVADSRPRKAYEFVIPSGYRPKALYIKNVRSRVGEPGQFFESVATRDSAINAGALMQGFDSEPMDDSRARVVSIPERSSDIGIDVGSSLRQRFSIIQVGQHSGLELADNNDIIEGSRTFTPDQLEGTVGLEQSLRITHLQTEDRGAVVQVVLADPRLGDNLAINLARPPASEAPLNEPIYLIDTSGIRYGAIGYFYRDREQARLRYTRGNQLRGLDELPSTPSIAQRDQRITLLFYVTSGSDIEAFAIGNTVIAKFDPPIDATERRRR